MKKAFDWLKQNNIDYDFHDYKKEGVETSKLTEWIDKKGLDIIVNKRGMTYRKLEEDQKELLTEMTNNSIQLISEKTSMIKRPIIETKKGLVIGFDEEEYSKSFL